MKTAGTSFDGVSAAFYEYEQSVRGAVRYELARENLAPYLEGPKKRILDIGGGSGPDTAWAASLGHTVLLLEPSSEQLAIARDERFPPLDQDVRARIATKHGNLAALPDKMHESFDAVMSHGVAMYLEYPEAYWEECVGFIKPGGLFSILEKGYGGTAMRLARENKINELREFLPSKRLAQNNMGRRVWAFTFNEMQKMVERLGCEVIKKAGIRQITDHMYQPKAELDSAAWTTFLNEERLLSRDIQEMHSGQMLQVIARKK